MPHNHSIPIACTSPSRVQALQAGHLLDAQLYPLGLDTMTQQYFSPPVTPTWHLMNHIHHMVASDATTDYESIWHDILMVFAITGYAQQLNHRFVVNISQQAWLLQATTEQDEQGFLFNILNLVNTPIQPPATNAARRFATGHIVMTAGAAALNTDFFGYLTRYLHGDWGDVAPGQWQGNETAANQHQHPHAIYEPAPNTHIWIITNATRTATIIMLPDESQPYLT